MSVYDITVFLVSHGPEHDGRTDLSTQTFPSDRMQILPVKEDDPLHPRRNTVLALGEARGRYTLILDQGDSFSRDFIQALFTEAQKEKSVMVMPSQTCIHVKRTREQFSLEGKDELHVSLTEIPAVFPTCLNGLLIQTSSLLLAAENCPEEAEPEKQILASLLDSHPEFFYLGSQNFEYFFPREHDYEYCLSCLSRDWYFTPLTGFLLPLLKEQKPSLYVQCLALYMLNTRILANLNNRNKNLISRREAAGYAELFSDVLERIDTRLILNRSCQPLTWDLPIQLMEVRLKKRDFSYYPSLSCQEDAIELSCDGVPFGTLKNIQARINLIDYRKGCLEIDGGFQDYFSSRKAEIYAEFDGKTYAPVYNQRYSMTKCFGVTFYRLKTFHMSIPVPDSSRERILRFCFRVGGKTYLMDFAFPSHTSRFCKDLTYAYWRFGPYLSYWKKDGIHIQRSRKLMVLYKELRLWKQMWQLKDGMFRDQLPLKVLNFLLRPWFSRRKIWFFFDKIYKGGDSSEYLYRYSRQFRDGIHKYYLLDPSCPDYSRLQKEGLHPVRRGSLKHRLLFLNADMVIASNSTVFAFNDYTFQRSLPIRGDVHFGVACVQHGMSVQKIAVAQNRLRDNTKLYFCASKYEIANLSKPVYDYEGYNALKLTGVPRYDGLKNQAQKILLLSPTWRMNSVLPVTKNEGVARDYNPNFKETNYYKIYNGLINDPLLLNAAKKYGYRIQYVLHPIISPQAEDFTKNEFVEIIPSTGDMSYEKIFREAALMVTDFSGVQFDFAYMRKPVVYLHHRDIPQHYEEGTFYYDTMGFGEICHTNEELVQVLCQYMERDCQMREKYKRRADDFFTFSDHKNCERIYKEMIQYQQKEV